MLKQNIKNMSYEQIISRVQQIDNLMCSKIELSAKEARDLWDEQDKLLYELKNVRGLIEF